MADEVMIKRVGAVRPSQLIWSYGPGALVDLPNLSAMTLGINEWKLKDCTTVSEPRLLNLVQRILGPQVQKLMAPPVDEDDDFYKKPSLKGAPVRLFPSYFQCMGCGMLGTLNDNFELKANNYRPDTVHVVHSTCPKNDNKPMTAMPMRYMLACDRGHLDDFPWRWYVHHDSEHPDCTGRLFVRETGSFLQIENLTVYCEACEAQKALMPAFNPDAAKYLPICRGRHPHLSGCFESCGRSMRTVLLGASNLWFPILQSVLAVPAKDDELTEMIRQRLDKFQFVQRVEDVPNTLKMIELYEHVSFNRYKPEEVFIKLSKIRQVHSMHSDENIFDSDAKRPEWRCFIQPKQPSLRHKYNAEKIEPPLKYKERITEVLLIHRLCKVNALVGFTRLTSLDDIEDMKEYRAPIADGAPSWVPASEIHGEGIFIRFSEEAVREWEEREAVVRQHEKLCEGYKAWCLSHEKTPHDCPDARFFMLHTFAHLIICELSLSCGYNAASIGERIYATRKTAEDTLDMAGVLIYTAAADSDGTLGGLVELGKSEKLGEIMYKALERAEICTADPICADNQPEKEPLAAACHACCFVSETSCEHSNRFLDRSLVIPTINGGNAAFFPEA